MKTGLFLFCSLFLVASSLSGQSTKKVLLEKFSSSWCGNCPDASLVIEDLLLQHPENLIVVVHHAGFWSDSMTIQESTWLAQEFATGTPTAMVDRRSFNGGQTLPSISNSWANRIAKQLDTTAFIGLEIESTYHSVTRELKVAVKTQVEQTPPVGYLRLHVFLTENGVTGSGIGYEQQNYYSKDYTALGGPSHPLYQLPHPIPNYVHNHVIRVSLTDFWGMNGTFADAPAIGDATTRNFTTTLSPSFDPTKMQVVAFVAYHNGTDKSNRSIVNSQAVELWDGVSLPPSDENSYEVLPEFATGIVTLKATLTGNRTLQAQWIGLDGRLISSQTLELPAGDSETRLPLPGLADGIYLLYLDDGEQQITRKTAFFSDF